MPQDVRPFIAATDSDGDGMCQTSTEELRGRKLFVWGMGEGGRHWQTFLSKKGSAYVELQAGLAHTQLEHLPMAGSASISWLESYGAVHAEADKANDPDWSAAVSAVRNALDEQRPASRLQDWHERAKKELDGVSGGVIHTGMGYAVCEKALLGDAFDTAGLNLDAMHITSREQLWLDLITEGILPCADTLDEPLSYQIGEEWEKLLRASLDKEWGDHWFSRYHLGVMANARGDVETAKAEYRRSIEMAVNPWAMRCLAVCLQREGKNVEAGDLLMKAAAMKPIRPLIVEALDALLQVQRYDDMLSLTDSLPASLRENGRVKTFVVAALLRTGRVEEAGALLTGSFVLTDVREGQVLLTDLWFEYAALRDKGDASPESIQWARMNRKPPHHLDFRMN